jgi:hypothetical protein
MQDSNTNEGQKHQPEQKPDTDATSKEMLSDVEESEKDSRSSEDLSGPGPSPDGALDESDELKDAGPM